MLITITMFFKHLAAIWVILMVWILKILSRWVAKTSNDQSNGKDK